MIPRLVVITDWSRADLLPKLEAALAAGPIAVQHRHPEATTRAYFEEGVRLKALCDRFAAPMFVSARLDVALALGAHLHLPSRALRPAVVRGAMPAGRWVSVAVHEEADVTEGADLALVSPVFPTRSKPGAVPLGREGFERIAAGLKCPAYALGGVTAGWPGLAGMSVISAVLDAADPAAAVRALLGSTSK